MKIAKTWYKTYNIKLLAIFNIISLTQYYTTRLNQKKY